MERKLMRNRSETKLTMALIKSSIILALVCFTQSLLLSFNIAQMLADLEKKI